MEYKYAKVFVVEHPRTKEDMIRIVSATDTRRDIWRNIDKLSVYSMGDSIKLSPLRLDGSMAYCDNFLQTYCIGIGDKYIGVGDIYENFLFSKLSISQTIAGKKICAVKIKGSAKQGKNNDNY